MTDPLFTKKIWFLWLQGYEDMPELVRRCYESWHKYNPGWEIIFLDRDNVDDYVNVSPIFEDRSARIYRVSQSEIIRINLLHQYGGVWVDATCFCCQPLDDWIGDYLDSGFFAFHRPGVDRMLSSWFLAAKKGNDLIRIYCEEVNAFWPSNKKIHLWIDKKMGV